MNQVKKILWLSRHQPLAVQIAELERMFGRIDVRQDVNPFNNAQEIKQRFERGGYDDLVVVAPLWLILKLTEFGIKPLWAEMLPVGKTEEYHICYNGRFYFFNRFRRIIRVEVVFEDFE
jgi:hypothetical protein